VVVLLMRVDSMVASSIPIRPQQERFFIDDKIQMTKSRTLLTGV
jgi:hypothetical protein